MAAENFSVIQALYWTVCTMLTIGYGDFDIQRESTRIFLTWFMWLCVIVYVIAITNIVSTFEDLKADALRYEILRLHAVDIVDVLDEKKRVNNQEVEDGMGGAKNTFKFKTAHDIHELRSSLYIEPEELSRPEWDKVEGERDRHKHRGPHYKGADKRGISMPTASIKVRFDDVNEVVNVTATDVRDIVDRAKEDRFILEMLMKMNKVSQTQDIDVLVKHYRKVEDLRNLAAKGDASRNEVIEKLEADNQKTMLGGLTKNYLLANNNTLRGRKSKQEAWVETKRAALLGRCSQTVYVKKAYWRH